MRDHALQVRRDCREQRGEVARRDDVVRQLEERAQVFALRLQLALARERLLLMAHVVDRHRHLAPDVSQEPDVALAVRPLARRREYDQSDGSECRPERQETRGPLAEPTQRRDDARVLAARVEPVQDDRLGLVRDGGSEALLVERRNRDRLNLRRRCRLGRSEPDGVQVRGLPFVEGKNDAEQIEIGDRPKAACEVRKELVETGMATDQMEDAEQRLDACLVAPGGNVACVSCWHCITRGRIAPIGAGCRAQVLCRQDRSVGRAKTTPRILRAVSARVIVCRSAPDRGPRS